MEGTCTMLSCPFCKGTRVTFDQVINFNAHPQEQTLVMYSVKCTDCGAEAVVQEHWRREE